MNDNNSIILYGMSQIIIELLKPNSNEKEYSKAIDTLQEHLKNLDTNSDNYIDLSKNISELIVYFINNKENLDNKLFQNKCIKIQNLLDLNSLLK